MWPLPVEVAFLVAAGVLAGTASSSGAIGSLVAYPALLLVGLPPITANITNAVAVTAVAVGAAAGSRPELAQVPRTRLLGGATVAGAGGLAGGVLLLATPEGLFAQVVPWLVLVGVVTLAATPLVRNLPAAGERVLFPVGLAVTTTYEGYFGAGAGVMTLAVVLLTVDRSLPRANALKNVLLGVADAVVGLLFVATGSVAWVALAALATGYLGGGLIGPVVTRRVPPVALRAVVIGCGLVLFVVLLARA